MHILERLKAIMGYVSGEVYKRSPYWDDRAERLRIVDERSRWFVDR